MLCQLIRIRPNLFVFFYTIVLRTLWWFCYGFVEERTSFQPYPVAYLTLFIFFVLLLGVSGATFTIIMARTFDDDGKVRAEEDYIYMYDV